VQLETNLARKDAAGSYWLTFDHVHTRFRAWCERSRINIRHAVEQSQINIRVAGDREPTLLFVHGFGCAIDDWRAQLDELSATFKCVALDLPGHGASAMPKAPSIVALASAVNVAKEQTRSRDVILVGHSLGAKVIREAYAQSKSSVIGLVFIEGRFNEGDRATLVQAASAAIERDGFVPWAQHHFAEMFIESSDADTRERVLRRVLKLEPTFGRELFVEALGWDPVRGKETLSNIALPVLLLQSTYFDSYSHRQSLKQGMTTPFMDLVTSMIPTTDAQVITGCGHFPMIEAAAVVNEAIRSFATRIPKS
jgi:pimeloyl-ACP methyl ester carboxylesterase